MTTPRTATTVHKKWRTRVIANARAAGVTRCPLCGVELDYENFRSPHYAQADHIVPFSLGGEYTEENGRAICAACNASRGNGARASRRIAARARSITTLAEW